MLPDTLSLRDTLQWQKLLKPLTCPLRTISTTRATPLAAVSSPPPPIWAHKVNLAMVVVGCHVTMAAMMTTSSK